MKFMYFQLLCLMMKRITFDRIKIIKGEFNVRKERSYRMEGKKIERVVKNGTSRTN